MKKPISELATLSTGLYLQPSQAADILYLQARHFDDEGTFDFRVEPEVTLDARQSKHLLLPGDVLFASKGHSRFAVLYQPSMGKAVASSVFLVIRLTSHSQVLPAFLVWYLNHPATQANLKSHERTATVPSLTLQDIAKLEIQVPTLAKQSAVVQVDALRRRETDLRGELQKQRDHLIQNTLLQAIR